MKSFFWVSLVIFSCQKPQHSKSVDSEKNFIKVDKLTNQIAALSSEIKSFDYRIKNQQNRIESLSKELLSLSDNDKNKHTIEDKEVNDNSKYINTKQVVLTFDSMTTEINLSDYIGEEGVYTVDVRSIDDVEWVNKGKAEYRLNVSSRIKKQKGSADYVGLISYFQYQIPEPGIQNMVSNPILINYQNPNLFIDSNENNILSGKITLWISGYYK